MTNLAGVLHYYFKDKAELILFCIRRYKTRCATRYDYVIATAGTPEEMLDGVFQKALLDHLSGRAGVADELAATAKGALPLFLAPA